MSIRIGSVLEPFESAEPEAAREAAWAMVLADAMGLLAGERDVERLDLESVRRVARAAGQAGIGVAAAAELGGRHPRPERLRRALRNLREALEDSPAPASELPALAGLLGVEAFAGLLAVSPASLRRYAAGARPTPDEVAARAHLLARVVADLKGAYSDVGVRRWFGRRRTALGGRSPAQVLRGPWSPEDAGPARVLELARSLAWSPAT